LQCVQEMKFSLLFFSYYTMDQDHIVLFIFLILFLLSSSSFFSSFFNYNFLLVIAGLHLYHLLAALSFPICFLKQVVNVIQFKNAADHLVSVDMALRKKNQKPKK